MTDTMTSEHESAATTPPRGPRGRIAYIVFDLHDPAVHRRIAMLQKGGASVRLAGFRRRSEPLEGCIDLGRTHARQMVRRALSVLRAILAVLLGRIDLGRPDTIVCRNLECLVVGSAYRALWSRRSAIVYEVLDIHRSMVGSGIASRVLRGMERALASTSTGVITSSPGFVKAYFEAINPLGRPLTIVENKVFYPQGMPPASVAPRPAKDGWFVGWFGGLRCGRSFEVLTQAAARMGGALHLVLAGRVAATEIPDFEDQASAAPYLDWRGPYSNPDDLPRLYGEVHFVWTIDFHEAETNSRWLLPNRLYEGGLFGAVPIARSGTETAEWMRERGIGLILDEVDPASVEVLLGAVTPEEYRELQLAVAALPQSTWITTEADCTALVDVIIGSLEGFGRHLPAPAQRSAT